MTTAHELDPDTAEKADTATVAGPAVPVAWYSVLGVTTGLVVLLFTLSNRYDYVADELYFRMLGARGPAWGYVDQPPALPILVHLSSVAFGDTVWGIRVPAVLSAAAVVIVFGMIAAELGGARRAQLLTTFCVATSTMVLSFGHWILTTSLDTVTWSLVLLFALRALLRRNGRYWIATGVLCGLGLYVKYLELLLPAALLAGLLVIGPWSVFRDRRLYLGMGLAVLIGLPNLIYQITHQFPQVQMARALGATDGADDRAMFGTNLLLEIGPILTFFWLIGLWRLFRDRARRPLRCLGVGSLVAAGAALVIDGGRPDYVGGLLLLLLTAGCVTIDRWLGRRPVRWTVVSLGLVVTTAAQIYLGLPVLPAGDLASTQISSMQLESVGWGAFAAQVDQVYRGLSAPDRAHSTLLAMNFGEAGALDRYRAAYHFPAVHSGNNELFNWGPPPDDAGVVVAVGFDRDWLARDFTDCVLGTHIDNGLGVDNPEQGAAVYVCRGRRAPWARLWPAYRQLYAYP